ncbi:hypothetical protein B0H13DRAFT_2031455 [Mycena leptocephala]|nr:hypothetical protein B0H13DRAFT_2031455 [Mycena leptocephala]
MPSIITLYPLAAVFRFAQLSLIIFPFFSHIYIGESCCASSASTSSLSKHALLPTKPVDPRPTGFCRREDRARGPGRTCLAPHCRGGE